MSTKKKLQMNVERFSGVPRLFAGCLLLFLFGTSSILLAQNRTSETEIDGQRKSSAFSTQFFPTLAASINLDQCRNGAPGSPVQCISGAWQNGNLGTANSSYLEGGSVAYRATISGLTAGSAGNTLQIDYDTTVSGDHAFDYLTNFNRSETNADPCTGTVPGCGQFADFPIADDPNVTGAGVVPLPGSFFRIYGGTITGMSAYTLTGTYAGTSNTAVTVTFSSIGTDVVIAWGGHIATRADWGVDNSAVTIGGSPFHMRVLSTGNQDRSLNSDAVIVPAKVTIIKEITLVGGGTASLVSFPFTATGLASSAFSLVDNNVVGPDRIIDNTVTTFGAGSPKTVTESLVTGWTLADIECVETPGGLPNTVNSTVNLGTRTATIIAERGEFVTCTFRNQQLAPTAAHVIVAGRVVDESGNGIPRAALVLLNTGTSERKSSMTNSFGYYRFEDLPVGHFYVLSVFSKSYTFPDNDRGFNLIEDSTVNFIGQSRSDSLVNQDSRGMDFGPWSEWTKP